MIPSATARAEITSCSRFLPFSRGVTCQRQLAKSSAESECVPSMNCVSGDALSMKKPPSGARKLTDITRRDLDLVLLGGAATPHAFRQVLHVGTGDAGLDQHRHGDAH